MNREFHPQCQLYVCASLGYSEYTIVILPGAHNSLFPYHVPNLNLCLQDIAGNSINIRLYLAGTGNISISSIHTLYGFRLVSLVHSAILPTYVFPVITCNFLV